MIVQIPSQVRTGDVIPAGPIGSTVCCAMTIEVRLAAPGRPCVAALRTVMRVFAQALVQEHIFGDDVCREQLFPPVPHISESGMGTSLGTAYYGIVAACFPTLPSSARASGDMPTSVGHTDSAEKLGSQDLAPSNRSGANQLAGARGDRATTKAQGR